MHAQVLKCSDIYLDLWVQIINRKVSNQARALSIMGMNGAENISKYLEYSFYAITVFLVYILILRPVKIILFSPSFSIETTLDEDSRKNRRVYNKYIYKYSFTILYKRNAAKQ